MGWLVAVIAAAIFIWFLLNYPQFRIAVVVIVAVVALYIWNDYQREAKSHSLIAPSQLSLSNVTLRFTPDSYHSAEIDGAIRNDSPHTLKYLALKVTIRD